MELWYTQPAVDWNAALPAGNGRLGCMQFGGVARERFQLNEDSLWSGGPMHRLNPDASATLPKVQELLRQGRLPDAERLALDGLASTPCGMRAYQPLGDLTLDFDGLPAEADDYCRGLDLDAGTLYVRFTVGGAHYAREAFVSYPDGVFVLRLTTCAAMCAIWTTKQQKRVSTLARPPCNAASPHGWTQPCAPAGRRVSQAITTKNPIANSACAAPKTARWQS